MLFDQSGASLDLLSAPRTHPATVLRYDLTHSSGLGLHLGASAFSATSVTVEPLLLDDLAFGLAPRQPITHTFTRLSAEAGLGYTRRLGRWALTADVGAVGLSPKQLDAGGRRWRLDGRVLAKAGAGVTYGLTERWGLTARYDYLSFAHRGLLGAAYRW